jgi:N-dimethylarginine dimethylaminohydrolase
VDEKDAASFACNAVEANGRIFLNDASPELQAQLINFGLEPVVTPLSEFLKAGGGAKCLTLRLDEA